MMLEVGHLHYIWNKRVELDHLLTNTEGPNGKVIYFHCSHYSISFSGIIQK